MSTNSAWTTAVNAWHRLWSVGANGEKIQNKTKINKSNDTRRKRRCNNNNRVNNRSTTTTPTAHIQTDLHGNPQDTNDGEAYGDILAPKHEGILRLMLHNVNCLPADAKHEKSKKLIATIAHKQIDIALLTEAGLCWSLVDNTNKWYERTRLSFQASRSELAFNKTELTRTSQRQYGGVIAMAVDDVAHRVKEQGQDPTGLGRWAWLLLEGKQNHQLRVISVYRPVDSVGPDTVYSQQQRFLFQNQRHDNPRKALYTDLYDEVEKWKNAGEHIIIGIDANEDVRTGDTINTFRALGMREMILQAHQGRSPPATCNKNKQREPIDGIFATPGLRLIAGGYAPYDSGCFSDHRYLWVDISFCDAFGYTSPALVAPPIRRLKTTNPKLVHKYNEQLKQKISNTGLANELFALEQKAKSDGWSHHLEKEYNRINDKQYELRKKIEAKIRKIRNGEVPWSPKLQKFRTAIEIWTLLLKKRKGTKISQRKLRRKLHGSDITGAFTKTIPELEDALHEAYTQYKKAKKEAEIWREEFMSELATACAAVKGTDKANELKQLLTIERQRTIARNIKRMQGKLQRNATIQIYVNDANGRRLVTDKTEMEEACMEENDARFSQSESTPPMTSPLLTDLGYLADTPEAQAILQGTYTPPPETDQYAALFLKELRMPDNIIDNPMDTVDVTPEDNARAWNKQKESVSSEPEGLTFSHYKAGAQDEEINRFDALLRCLPYKYGFSPAHWQEITDVEILKKAGVYDIDKMRTITLMDAAFNMNNKKLGRDLMAHSEKMGNLAREQYGSRKHHQACTAATNKVLTMDLLRLRRQAGALCSNDAKSCYDRIVHSVAALAMVRQGAPVSAVRSLLLTLQQAKHKIRTGFGVSVKHYGRFRWPPLQGLGQGNGVAPTGWAVISTVLINMMRTALFGLQVSTCLSAVIISFLCYAFVDDTDLVHTGPSVDTTGTEILHDMRRFVAHWEGGLSATGGALRVDKSYWYLIDFKWQSNGWHYITKDDLPGEIQVRDADGEIKTLPRLEPSEANETLGIYIAMDGNTRKQVEKLRHKAEDYAENVRTGFLTRDEAWHSLKSTIVKTLEYPMEAISLTKDQWDYIMAPILKAILPRSGIVRTFPRDILYGPDQFSGMGLMHPYYTQYFRHLDLTLKEATQPSITSNLLQATTEQLKLEIGIPCTDGNWQLPAFHKCLTNCWMKDLLLFCDDHDITLHDTCATLEKLTTEDIYLMQAFTDADYEPTDLRTLNECRMYLRAITLSDLCTMDLKTITFDAYNGNALRRRKHLGWPRKPPSLPASHWNLWKKALTKCFLTTGNSHRTVRQNLGQWLPAITSSWDWFFSPSESRLYHKHHHAFQTYSRSHSSARHSSSRYRLTENQDLHENKLPDDVQLATVALLPQHNVMLTGVASIPTQTTSTQIPYHSLTIEEILDTRHENDKWAVDTFHSDDDGAALAMGIIQGHATAVNDGSYKNNVGTSGFILRGANRTLGAVGANAVPGNPEEQSSYRSELAGISGSLAIISAVCDKYGIVSGSITIALDGQQAMLKSRSLWPLSPGDKDFDLLTDIRAKIRKLPISIHWEWIEGHQDDHIPFHRLSPLAQDNVIADGIAKDHMNKIMKDGYYPEPQRFGDEGWSISIQGCKMSHLDYHKLYTHMWANTAQEYWAKKHNISIAETLSIDWDACGEAIQSLSFPKRRRIVKHACGHFGIGKMMLLWKFQDHDECPLCNQRETPEHVLQCKDQRALDTWKLALTKLETWMEKNYTNPALSTAIITRLKSWHDYQPIAPPSWTCTFSPTLLAQQAIGWYPLLMGHLSNQWKGIQQAYYSWIGRRRTGKKWIKLLIVQLFNISWDMWEHRNAIKHNTPTAAKLRELQSLDDTIRDEYSLGTTNLIPRDHQWFQVPLETVLQEYDINKKQQWIVSVAQARMRWKRRLEHVQHSQNASRQILRNWLTPIPNPPPANPNP